MQHRLCKIALAPVRMLKPIISVSVRGPLTRLATVSVAAALVAPVLPVSVTLAQTGGTLHMPYHTDFMVVSKQQAA